MGIAWCCPPIGKEGEQQEQDTVQALMEAFESEQEESPERNHYRIHIPKSKVQFISFFL